MSNIQTGAERMPHDLSHLGFLAGQIGRLITISTTPVIAGDSFEMDAVGALRLSPLRRGLAIDSTVDIFTFYVPHRHVYGEQWIKFMKDGVNATPLPTVNTTGYIDHAAFLGTINPDTNKIPKHLFQGRSEERFSRNAETELVCRLLLEKKNGRPRRPGGGSQDSRRGWRGRSASPERRPARGRAAGSGPAASTAPRRTPRRKSAPCGRARRRRRLRGPARRTPPPSRRGGGA